MEKVIEIKHTTLSEGKGAIKGALGKPLNVPSYGPQLDGRWRAVSRGERELKGDRAWFVEKALKVIDRQTTVGDQRDVYYGLRGAFPTKTVGIGDKQHPLKSEKVYNLFTGDVMEYIQLLTGVTMQSFGIRAGPRGFIFSQDGQIYVPRKRITYNLDGSPVLYFDLADEGVSYEGPSKKVIHFEKAAGFERLTSGDISRYVEAIFSTSQGQLSEAANKFLAENEARGLKIYSMHDADPYGLQMNMLYGLASKNNAYMPTSFYAKGVTTLGLLPRVAKEIGLLPEDIAEQGMKIVNTNISDMVKERPELREDYEIMRDEGGQWEIQALNGLHELASQIYIVEALRIKNDEIKHVPEDVATPIKDRVREKAREYADNAIDRHVRDFINEKIYPQLLEQIRVELAPTIDEFSGLVGEQVAKLDSMDASQLREAVKLKLVKTPQQYWDDAVRQVVNDMLDQKFEVTSDIEFTTDVKSTSADTSVTVSDPEYPDKTLTKDDITEAIEKRIITKSPERQPIVTRIRGALEKVFGEPRQDW